MLVTMLTPAFLHSGHAEYITFATSRHCKSALRYVIQVLLPTSSLSSVRELFPLLDLPAEMQRLVLGYLPLTDLARLACLNKELRAAYGERVTKRDTAVAALLQSQFTAKFRQGLSPAQTALPRDLVAHPQVGRWSFIPLVLCCILPQSYIIIVLQAYTSFGVVCHVMLQGLSSKRFYLPFCCSSKSTTCS
jgi:hypothetical protein